MCSGCPGVGRLVLWYEIFLGARYAVVISPAIDHRQLRPPVAMFRWCVGGLPFECRGPPRIAARRLALGQTPDQVEQEHHLHGCYEQGRNGDRFVHRMDRVGKKLSAAKSIVPPWHTQD